MHIYSFLVSFFYRFIQFNSKYILRKYLFYLKKYQPLQKGTIVDMLWLWYGPKLNLIVLNLYGDLVEVLRDIVFLRMNLATAILKSITLTIGLLFQI